MIINLNILMKKKRMEVSDESLKNQNKMTASKKRVLNILKNNKNLVKVRIEKGIQKLLKEIKIFRRIKTRIHQLYFHVRSIRMKSTSIMIVKNEDYFVHNVFYLNLEKMISDK